MSVLSLARVVVVLSLAVVGSGCINSGTLVKVKPDGSGTLEQTLLVNMQTLKGFMAGMGGAGEVKQSGGVLTEAEFKRAAERMGVKPVSLTPLTEGGFEGARALYAFDDITKIRVDQDPPMSGSSSGTFQKSPTSSAPIRFSLAKQGGASVLTIAFDEKAMASASEKAPAAPKEVDPAMMQMLKGIFQGFRIAIDLGVDGTIVKTNADYVNGSRITLLEVDMAALLEDEAKLKELQSRVGPGVTISQMKPFLKNVKGVKINHPTVTIEYR